jgi:hypothetical protein
MKTIKFLLAMLLLATTASATFADEPAVKQPGLSEAVKKKVLSQLEALKAKKSPFTGKTASCDGDTDVIVAPTVGVLSVGVILPKLSTKGQFLQIKSTIQCNTDVSVSSGRISSLIAIVDTASNVFCALPSSDCNFSFYTCNATEDSQFHTGIWWFEPLLASAFETGNNFVSGAVAVARVDFGENGDETIAFKSLCVDLVK